MKKILSLIFLSLLTLALVACGGKKEEATKNEEIQVRNGITLITTTR